MGTDRTDSNFAMPLDLTGWEKQVQIAAGERLAEIIESQGFRDFCAVVKLHSEGVLAQLTYRAPSPDSASYADVIGHLRGLSELEPIARGIVENGKEVAEDLRAREQEGQ